MARKVDGALPGETLGDNLEKTILQLGQRLNAPPSKDIVMRRFVVSDINACVVLLDGMAGRTAINEFILEPCLRLKESVPVQAQDRCAYLMAHVLESHDAELAETVGEVVSAVLAGKSALLVDGCSQAVLVETRLYEMRQVAATRTESVVQGPQEGFVENLKTNLSLIRRMVRSEMLINESMEVGEKLPTQLSMLYLKGVAKQETLSLIRQRISSLNVAQCPGSGYLQQLIEDHPYSLFPQMLQTERPDRVASCLSDGQVALLVDGSPYALVAPVTLYHLLHAPDDSFMRWQYGTFVRIVRMIGVLISLLLPGIYTAVTLFHTHMLPMALLTAIAETRSKVPFPVLVEVLFMEISFFLLNEAGTRMPGLLGSALGIVGALILGQAAVEASVISPILIIVVALTGLGNYAIPDYGVSMGMQILRLGFILAGAAGGFYGLTLLGVLVIGYLGWMKSFGVSYLAPVSPYYPHNGDVVVRTPLFEQTKELFTAARSSWMKRSDGPVRGWRRKK